jgi:protein ImuB
MNTPSRRYLSVWMRRLPTDRIAKQYAPDEALVVAAPVKSALRLSAVNDVAAALGLSVDMPLADARARYPKIAVAEADVAADLALLEAIADWCDRYTPLVGLDAPDGLTLDISGCAHLFGGEAAMAVDILRRLAAHGIQARAAVADTVGCAWGVARYASLVHRVAGETRRVGIIPSGNERNALSPLPLAALRLAPAVLEALAQVGLKRVADVLDRPRAPLTARFANLMVRLDQAFGLADEPITPRLPVPAALVEQRFHDPIALERDVLGTIERLARRLAPVLEQRGEGARLLQVALFRADGKVFRIEVGTGEPLRDPARIARLFAERLGVINDEIDPGFGFDVIRLCALVTERSDPHQSGLAAPDHAVELAHLIDRLGARFGLRRVTRLIEQDTHIPEYAAMAVGAHMVRHAWVFIGGSQRAHISAHARESEHREPKTGSPVKLALGPDEGRARMQGRAESQHTFELDSLAPSRPIRLFARPEPVEAIAELPDGPPAQFTWRRTRYVVLHAEGPERIAMEWWRDRSDFVLMRDYFRVETREGVRAWIFRSWPKPQTQEEKEQEYPKEEFVRRRTIGWFVHGVFA